MKKFTLSLSLSLLLSLSLSAQDTPIVGGVEPNLSLKNEIQLAITKGVNFLRDTQKEDGSWGDETLPALTALPLTATVNDPSLDPSEPLPEYVENGYRYLLSKQKTDGGIYGKGMGCYNTSLSLTALLFWDNPEAMEAKLAARRFLINQQSDFDVKGEVDNVFDGGVGYGGTYSHSDLSNTHFVMEALHYSKALVQDGSEKDRKMQLNWDAAIQFVSACQNREGQIESAVTDENRGGFIYFPGSSKAGTDELPDGSIALRSYGSMTYAGLLSFIYADMDPEDPRITAAMDWIKANFSLDENPGMDQEGLLYYYHTLAKALSITRTDILTLADGTEVDWRKELTLKLLNLQNPDGSFLNPVNRWMEGDPALATSFALMTLQRIHGRL